MENTWWSQLHDGMRANLKGLRVAVYGSGGAPIHHAGLTALWGGIPQMIAADEIRSGGLSEVDVICFPGGGIRAMEGMLEPLGTDGARAIRQWVKGGGMYLGSCAGSFLPAAVGENYWKAHEECRELYMVGACLANGKDSEWEGITSPGVGVLEMAVADPDHWLVEGLPPTFHLVHYNGPMFDLSKDLSGTADGLSHPEGAVRIVKATDAFTPSEGFMTSEVSAQTLFSECAGQGAYSALAAQYGKGTVVLFGSHPEFGFDVIQLGWGPGVRLLANALKHQAKQAVSRELPAVASKTSDNSSLKATLTQTVTQLHTIADRFNELTTRDARDWLQPDCAPSFMGRDAQTLWREALKRSAVASQDTAQFLERLAAQNLDFTKANHWIDHEAVAEQDYGFVGLRQLVHRLGEMVEQGEQQLSAEPFCLEHAYDGFHTHPYQILASSYLSAGGLTASVALCSAVIGALVDYTDDFPVGPMSDKPVVAA